MALLQEPLAHRTDLPRDLAMQMREWVPETLKSYLREIHRIAPRNASPAIDDAKTAIANDLPRAKPPATDSAQKLIDKLSASGQLKAGFLLRALNQGQTDLFDLGLAKLVNLPVIELRSRFYRGGPRAVALACRGVGIDRCVFNTVFNLSRQAHNMHVSLSYADLAEVDKVFSTVPKTSALSELSGPTFN
jgi:uncharacterized protein (DUF2336 family)